MRPGATFFLIKSYIPFTVLSLVYPEAVLAGPDGSIFGIDIFP